VKISPLFKGTPRAVPDNGKKGKRMDDAPAEGSKSKEPHQKGKRGKKGKKPRREAREQGRDDGGDEALAVDPA
jgi:hypothetical protein